MLTFARWLKANTDVSFEFLMLQDGPLRKDLAALAPTTVVDELSGRTSFLSRVRRRLFKTSDDHWHLRAFRKIAVKRYTTVFGNCIVCLPWLARFKESTAARCVCAVHELTGTIERYFDGSYVRAILPTMDRVVAGSHAVADNLIARYSIAPGLIEVVHSFVEGNFTVHRDKRTLRTELGIDPTGTVIVAVGNSGYRKGIDLVAPIAKALIARNAARRFTIVWLGAKPGDELVTMCKRDAAVLGVADRVIILDAAPGANDYIDLCDVFILPSREDAFPLVVLTAIGFGKPVVAFERSGGMDELLSDGAGCLVPYLDVPRFAEAIDRLLSDPEEVARLAATAKSRVEADHGIDRLARRLLDAISHLPHPSGMEQRSLNVGGAPR